MKPASARPIHVVLCCLVVGTLIAVFMPSHDDSLTQAPPARSQRDPAHATSPPKPSKPNVLREPREPSKPTRPKTASGDPPMQAVDEGIVSLSAEEQAAIDKYTLAGLSQAIAEADAAYMTASPSNKESADKHYLMLLNLAAKFAEPPPPLTPEQLARQLAYPAARDKELERLRDLPAAQREARMVEFKDRFFAADFAQEQAVSRGELHASQE
jgi:hypothetical protein